MLSAVTASALPALLLLATKSSHGFVVVPSLSSSSTTTALHASSTATPWWLRAGQRVVGNTNQNNDGDDDVRVKIDRTSPNSRRISGDIVVPAPIEDVWAILTDYDNLAVHVPNLVESRRVPYGGYTYNQGGNSEAGDGSYQCRLFQKGAQKIVGFEFGASVTMDMTERFLSLSNSEMSQRAIDFKCVESPFFSEFDGSWTAQSFGDETKISYTVDVRPRGPVPVAALEWRIKEDVPTNLKAVKKASIDVGYDGVMALRAGQQGQQRVMVPSDRADRPGGATVTAARLGRRLVDRTTQKVTTTTRAGRQMAGRTVERVTTTAATIASGPKRARLMPIPVPVMGPWYEDETMAAYLNSGSDDR